MKVMLQNIHIFILHSRNYFYCYIKPHETFQLKQPTTQRHQILSFLKTTNLQTFFSMFLNFSIKIL